MKKYILILLSLAVLWLESASADNWQVIASPNGSHQVNELHGVSAFGENDVWAVGVSYNTERSSSSTLIEHWDGARWSVVPSPNASNTLNILYSVAAIAANDVWAVGYAATSTSGAVIMHWNGSIWSVIPNPPSSIFMSDLLALAVNSPNDIWAVGSGRIGDEDATLTLHWNGTAWSFVPSPNVVPEVDNTLSGVAAVSSNDVWAVGTQQPTSLTDPHTLILHWNGSVWNIVPSPNDGGNNVGNHLLAAAAIAHNDVWAVGFSEFGTLAEHWDGSSWSVVQTASAGRLDPTFLPSVVALSSNNIWSVGEALQSGHLSRTLTEQWNGTNWIAVQSPNVGADHNELFGVDATPGGTLWAVGTVYHYPRQRTLIERKLP
ncbi:MAG TPA: hypothetical protein VFQ78_07035 [Candidatus Udaeobacter sp.]|nr:hypothetical protein [Candidatus Udaeobacter sp.]